MPLSVFGAKQFSYGVRGKIWGRAQIFRSAFVVNRHGNGAFKRKDNALLPIESYGVQRSHGNAAQRSARYLDRTAPPRAGSHPVLTGQSA